MELNIHAYLRLMRFHKPAGILLLWFPTAWALWLANQGRPPAILVCYFLLGTILMRAAGCIVNDIADRHVDKHVRRTSMRPLTTGELGLAQAFMLLIVLLMAAFVIVIQLPSACFYYAMAAVFITVLYPFCKRFFQAPQLVLGLAFSMGILMAYAASGIYVDSSTILLFLLNFAWIVAYDTMYAMADREDDLRIGVKSTAILFAEYDRLIILLLQLSFHSLWLVLAVSLHSSSWFYACWLCAWPILIYQQQRLSQKDPAAYLAAFFSNVWYGGVMWLALILFK